MRKKKQISKGRKKHTKTTAIKMHFMTGFTLFLLTRFVLKGFASYGRDLTDKETKVFLKAADKDGDGKIGIEGKRDTPFLELSCLKTHLIHQKLCCQSAHALVLTCCASLMPWCEILQQ